MHLFLDWISPQCITIFLSILCASLTVEGNSMLHLWLILLALYVAEMITLLFFKVCGTYHAKAGSLSMPLATANSATSTGLDSFESLSGFQALEPSFHSTFNFYLVVHLRRFLLLFLEQNYLSFWFTAAWYFLKSVMDLNIALEKLSSSTFDNKFSAMTLYACSRTWTSGNLTSHVMVFRIWL